jgi:predicted kinase
MTKRVYRRVATRAGTLLRAGRAVVCDAVHGLERERQAIERVATGFNVAFRGFWLEAPEAVLEARVAARAGDASDADVAVVRRHRELVDAEGVTWRRLRADRDLGELADELAAALEPGPPPG